MRLDLKGEQTCSNYCFFSSTNTKLTIQKTDIIFYNKDDLLISLREVAAKIDE